MIYIYLFVLGVVMGSFYTVIGIRRPLNQSIVKPRSHCPICNRKLKWYELIPLVSYIIQKGKCRGCKQKISFIYPLIELLCGILFCLSYFIYGFSYQTLIMLVLSSLLIIIFVSDFKYYIILDGPLVICSILILIINLVFSGLDKMLFSLLSGILLFCIMYLFKLFGDKVFKRESLGGGDIKLAFVIGVSLGFRLSFFSIVIASFIALPYAIYILNKKEDKEMPFGPFLISATLLLFAISSHFLKILDLLFYF